MTRLALQEMPFCKRCTLLTGTLLLALVVPVPKAFGTSEAPKGAELVARRWWTAVWQLDDQSLARLGVDPPPSPSVLARRARRLRTLLESEQPPPGGARFQDEHWMVEWPLREIRGPAGWAHVTLRLRMEWAGGDWRISRVLARLRARCAGIPSVAPVEAVVDLERAALTRGLDAAVHRARYLADFALLLDDHQRAVARAREYLAWRRLAAALDNAQAELRHLKERAALDEERMRDYLTLKDARALVAAARLEWANAESDDLPLGEVYADLWRAPELQHAAWWRALAAFHQARIDRARRRLDPTRERAAQEALAAVLTRYRELRPDSVAGYSDLAEVLLQLGRGSLAQQVIRAGRTRQPDSPRLAFLAWRAATGEERLDAAFALLRLDPEDSRVHATIGWELLARARFREAIPWLVRARDAEDPQDDRPHGLMLAHCYLLTGQLTAARDAAERALRREGLEPRDRSAAHMILALARLQMGDYQAARQSLLRALNGSSLIWMALLVAFGLTALVIIVGNALWRRLRPPPPDLPRERFRSSDYWWPLLALLAGQSLWFAGVDLLLSLGLSFLLMLATTLWVVRHRKGSVHWLGWRDRWPLRRVLVAAALLVPIVVLSEGITIAWRAGLQAVLPIELFRQLAQPSEVANHIFAGLVKTPVPAFLGMLLVAAVIGPIAEEVYFRGLLFGGLAERATVCRAAVLSTLTFAAMHMNPIALPAIIAIGLLLAWAYNRTDSLTLPIAIHILNNAVTLCLMRFFPPPGG
ncbi:MAG: CPBP family intramembrane metalloprotease [Armatimonadetes bacterium]|nr:CPBP family intramembrane metalloprotease [Armatimonadota bacterium]